MKEEILNEITQLQTEIERLEKEYDIYKYDAEASEPIKNNIDKKEKQIEDLLIPIKEELKEKEEEKNAKIEELTKEAEGRLERLESEYKIYEHDEQASGPIKNNINKIKSELEEKVEKINEEYETEKNTILDNISKTGIDLEKYGLKEKEEIEKEEIQEVKDEEEIEKDEQTEVVNPILANKTNEENSGKVVKVRRSGNVQIDNENEKTANIKVCYIAKKDEYIIVDMDTNEECIRLERKDIQEIVKTEELENLDNMDINIVKILEKYDIENGTRKKEQYQKIAMIGKSKQERQNEMEEAQLSIEYNLKGLYDKDLPEELEGKNKSFFEKEEIEEILRIANKAKNIGMAKVKKGIKVRFMEFVDKTIKMFNKNKLLKGEKVEQIPEKTEQNDFKDNLEADISLEEQRAYAERKEKEIRENSKNNEEKEVEKQ